MFQVSAGCSLLGAAWREGLPTPWGPAPARASPDRPRRPAAPAAQLPKDVIAGRRPEIPERLPEAPGDKPFAGLGTYKALMQRCWDADPAARPSFGELAVALR